MTEPLPEHTYFFYVRIITNRTLNLKEMEVGLVYLIFGTFVLLVLLGVVALIIHKRFNRVDRKFDLKDKETWIDIIVLYGLAFLLYLIHKKVTGNFESIKKALEEYKGSSEKKTEDKKTEADK